VISFVILGFSTSESGELS